MTEEYKITEFEGRKEILVSLQPGRRIDKIK